MTMHCERCGHVWPGHAETCETVQLLDCPTCKRRHGRIKAELLTMAKAGTLFGLDLLIGLGLTMMAHALAPAFGLSPLGLTGAVVTLYTLRRLGK